MRFTPFYSGVSLLHSLEVPSSNIRSDGSYRDFGSAYFSFVSHCGVVSAVTRLRARRSWVQIPVEARQCSLLRNVKNSSGANPASCSKLYRTSLPGINRPYSEFMHLTPSSSGVHHVRSYSTSTLHISLLCVGRCGLIFFR
jgi:hypothetical protein